VVHSKVSRSEQAVTRKLSEVFSIVIVFVAKNNRLRGQNRKRRQKLEESQKLEKKNRQKKKNQQRKPKNRQGKAS
jgi:regulator of replication initiation timing